MVARRRGVRGLGGRPAGACRWDTTPPPGPGCSPPPPGSRPTRGWSAVTVRRVAEEAGTTTRAVYSLFGSKQGLEEELHRAMFERLLEAHARHPHDRRPPRRPARAPARLPDLGDRASRPVHGDDALLRPARRRAFPRGPGGCPRRHLPAPPGHRPLRSRRADRRRQHRHLHHAMARRRPRPGRVREPRLRNRWPTTVHATWPRYLAIFPRKLHNPRGSGPPWGRSGSTGPGTSRSRCRWGRCGAWRG
jgi:AcrR family transcriptional regulator